MLDIEKYIGPISRFDRPRSPFAGRRMVDRQLVALCDESNLTRQYLIGFQQRDRTLDADICNARTRTRELQRIVDMKGQDLLAAQKFSFVNEGKPAARAVS